MNMKNKIATVFGGTGFVGRQVVRELAARGVIIKVATRVPERAYFLKPDGAVGQIVPVVCDYADEKSLAAAIAGSDYVINCIGVLFEKGKRQKFQKIHSDLPTAIAGLCAKAGVGRLVHFSALGVDKGTSKYAKTKLEGEKGVLANSPKATILRPSVIFGEDDSFFNMFAEMARYAPALPLIGGGKTKFQPVYVGDVARAVLAALEQPQAQGQIYELGGPDVLNFKEIYERLFRYTGRKRCLVSLPYGLAKVQASFMSVLPQPPLTRDQVESLKTDNVVSPTAQGLADLGVLPTALDVILPTYLKSYRDGGRFAAQ
ncbi:MAG: complex I NDUFA9 subunit family protein [Rhodospirillales bacterium]|nr:complex I NDUFA9 subunit family protein [Rhodospirillales bacterium]